MASRWPAASGAVVEMWPGIRLPPHDRAFTWWALLGSNQRPLPCKARSLGSLTWVVAAFAQVAGRFCCRTLPVRRHRFCLGYGLFVACGSLPSGRYQGLSVEKVAEQARHRDPRVHLAGVPAPLRAAGRRGRVRPALALENLRAQALAARNSGGRDQMLTDRSLASTGGNHAG
jgi:hypothetical protein